MKDLLHELDVQKEQIADYEQKVIEDLKKNEDVLSFLKNNNLDIDILQNKSYLFERYASSLKKCEGCKGLNYCKQKRVGEREGLSYIKPQIYEEIDYCTYRLLKEKNPQERNTLVYQDYANKLDNIELNDLKMDEYNRNLIYLLYQFLDGKRDKGLYLFGSFGVGKTYTMIALANELVKLKKKTAFVKVNDFINKMRKYAIEDPSKEEDLIQMMKKCDVLILDDIGNENVSAFSRDDILFVILDYRMENHKTTFFTSNQDIESLRHHYSYDKNQKEDKLKADRLMERIIVLAEPYCLKGEDKRKKVGD